MKKTLRNINKIQIKNWGDLNEKLSINIGNDFYILN